MIVDDCGTQRLTVNLVGRCWKCLHMFPPVHYWICLEEVGLRQLLQPWLKIQHPPDSASVFVLSPQSFTTWWPLPFKCGSLEKETQRFSPQSERFGSQYDTHRQFTYTTVNLSIYLSFPWIVFSLKHWSPGMKNCLYCHFLRVQITRLGKPIWPTVIENKSEAFYPCWYPKIQEFCLVCC